MEADIMNTNVTLDDHVDDQIAACLSLDAPRSFFLFAGAGSGKTRSLVNALKHIRKEYGKRLNLRGQRVGVITYTNAACDEIKRRIDFDPLFHASTIHSFAWDLIGGFNADIREWLRKNLAIDIKELEEAESKGRSGTKASITRQAQIESKCRRLASLDEIKTFTYSPTGENKERNSLSHAEVIKISASFLSEKPLLQRILVNQYPFLLIDESQDTNKYLVDALLLVEAEHRSRFSLGFLGDTMQRIYNDGKDRIEQELPDEWEKPAKKLNHRCPKRIVQLINRIRSAVDDHVQEPRSDSAEGCVRFFVFPAEIPNKPATEDAVRAYMAKVANDDEWNNREQCKILTLEHHMAAKRMGFQNIFDPLYEVEDFRTGMLDGTLPATRLFTQNILSLVTAQQRGDKFAAAKVVREFSPILSTSRLKAAAEPRHQLHIAEEAVKSLMSLWAEGEPTCGEVLENVAKNDLFSIPDSLKPLLKISETENSEGDSETELADPLPGEIVALKSFLEAPFSEILPYARYVSDDAPFDTHQGVKGLEFQRVMVLMDDSEARGFMFGYDKLLGAKERSAADLKNENDGKETTLDRTRRLFYVTCSRAQSSLALVAFSANPEAVKSHLVDNGWFDNDEIVLRLTGVE